MNQIFVFLRFSVLLVLVIFPAWVYAEIHPEERPDIRPGRYYGTIILTFNEFMEDLNGANPHEIGNAIVYLYGVADATKGKEWCGRVKTMEHINYLHFLLNRLDMSQHGDKRAADVIITVLREDMPCKKEGLK